MDSSEIAALVGDGNARVSVSYGMADKNFGSGFDAHVSVSLTCDQSQGAIGFAYEAASDVASEMISEAIDRARELWQEYGDGDGA